MLPVFVSPEPEPVPPDMFPVVLLVAPTLPPAVFAVPMSFAMPSFIAEAFMSDIMLASNDVSRLSVIIMLASSAAALFSSLRFPLQAASDVQTRAVSKEVISRMMYPVFKSK